MTLTAGLHLLLGQQRLGRERDIVGYRVYWAGPDKAVGGGDDVVVCPRIAGAYVSNTTHNCADTFTIGFPIPFKSSWTARLF